MNSHPLFTVSPAALPFGLAVSLLSLMCSMGCACSKRANVTASVALETQRVEIDRADQPQAQASDVEVERFLQGDALFEAVFREADGLGPLYIRSACVACHQDDARGPGVVTRVVPTPATAQVQAGLRREDAPRFGDTLRPYVTALAKTPLLLEATMKATVRLPPAVFGRGYMEAVAEEEIERLEREAQARSGAIRGRIHRLRDTNISARETQGENLEPASTIGRFGLKARSPNLDEFTADALQGDMGLTSALRPTELPNPDGVTDDIKLGLDVELATVQVIADYVRLLELPERKAETAHGFQLFHTAECATCHVPSLKTREDYALRHLAGQKVAVYTDFLLHDMGEELADGIVEGDASGREWRTAPLIGLRFLSAYLHDGRAETVEAAILAHAGTDSEANPAVERFRAFNVEERATLLAFVEQL